VTWIQVCIYRDKKVPSNVEMTPDEFLCGLINAKPVTVIFEACGTSNYWLERSIEAGYDARLISAKLVSAVRQNQKTDKNDVLAITQAALLPNITFISSKSVEQQQL
jgi:transposase